MNTRTTIFSSAFAAAALVGGANADIYTGAGGTVADNNATGSRFTINVSQSLILSGVSVTLTNFQHNNIGDLVATLSHIPSNSTISLFDRVGRVTTASNNAGDSSDFNGNYRFADGGSSLWAAAAAGNSGADMASSNYYASGSGIGSAVNTGPTALSFATTFGGKDAQGDWVLEVKDLRSGTSLSSGWSWAVEFATIPAPGALALIGAAGLVGFGRRRR